MACHARLRIAVRILRLCGVLGMASHAPTFDALRRIIIPHGRRERKPKSAARPARLKFPLKARAVRRPARRAEQPRAGKLPISSDCAPLPNVKSGDGRTQTAKRSGRDFPRCARATMGQRAFFRETARRPKRAALFLALKCARFPVPPANANPKQTPSAHPPRYDRPP